eukprot:g2616.t1
MAMYMGVPPPLVRDRVGEEVRAPNADGSRMVSKGLMDGWGTVLLGKAFMGANLEWRHDQLCKRLEGIGNAVGWTCVLEADAQVRSGLAPEQARLLRQAEKDFERATKNGNLTAAEGAARRGLTAAGCIREVRDARGIRPDLLVRSNGSPVDDVSDADWRKQIDGLLEAKSMVLCMTNYGMLKFWKSASRCEALGSRAAAGRGTAEGEGIRDNVHDGRMAGSFTMAGLEAVAAAGTGGADGKRGQGEPTGAGGRGTQPSDDSSSRDGRLRENNLTIAPSHPEDSKRGGSGGGDTHGSGSGSGRAEGSGASSDDDCESRSEGSGGNIGGTSSSDSSRAAGNKAKKKSKVGAGVGETESRLGSRVERVGGTKVGPGRNGSTSGG